jgi:hypothetical protein
MIDIPDRMLIKMKIYNRFQSKLSPKKSSIKKIEEIIIIARVLYILK